MGVSQTRSSWSVTEPAPRGVGSSPAPSHQQGSASPSSPQLHPPLFSFPSSSHHLHHLPSSFFASSSVSFRVHLHCVVFFHRLCPLYCTRFLRRCCIDPLPRLFPSSGWSLTSPHTTEPSFSPSFLSLPDQLRFGQHPSYLPKLVPALACYSLSFRLAPEAYRAALC
ncbi:hypothetical protein EX30DRAFT_52294 [Ascodesmis nigricans]|uniref:Uncharacterized protein n=1 Tax=Ascodesmis nigricans TaxID=341454 RepID=A0A4S2MVE1_9PEZI|nr:hypothetical protein EX30DRAFT_52294 [Ascodesmis nigricans]